MFRHKTLHNLPSDVIGLVDTSGNLVVEYKYNAWGSILGTSTLSTAYSTLTSMNPFRYRGYIYDEETWMYYCGARYYYPELQRWINADALLGKIGALSSHNMFYYCGNNPVTRSDDNGHFWETILDVISLGASIVEVATTPTDPWAWAGLAGDALDLVPFVTGLGEGVRGIKTTVAVVNKADDVIDSAKAIYRIADTADDIILISV